MSKDKMIEREKELEMNKKNELFELESMIDNWISDYDISHLIAKNIQQAGYTKKRFPVEELIKWLEEDTQTHELKSIIKAKGVDCFSGLGLNVGLGVISIVIRLAFDTVEHKIKELEDG